MIIFLINYPILTQNRNRGILHFMLKDEQLFVLKMNILH